MIEIRHLDKIFHTPHGNITALQDINLHILPGEIFGIIGLSGAGKSTLVRCMNLLERPTEGDILVDGRSLLKMKRSELLETRRSVGMIFQSFNLLEQRTALGNVCFPLEMAGVPRKQAVERAKELIEMVGLSDRLRSYPSQLSGGQKQRIAIARALANKPKVLLCDEATSALDPNTTASILSLLQDINRKLGVTVVVITHEMSVIEKICHRVAVIDQSRIVEMGTVHDVFAAPKSDIAKELILPKSKTVSLLNTPRKLRIVFDGNSAFEPVLSNLILTCQTPVNILFADTKDIDGKAYGQMILQLPEDDLACDRIRAYLKTQNVTYREELD